MRIALPAGLLALAVLASADTPSAFSVPTRTVSDPYDRITVTVPERWVDRAPGDNEILHVQAPGSYGGHDLTVTLENGLADRDTQRTRYLAHDGQQRTGAVIRQFDTPWFGYRLEDESGNRVLVRSFLSSGGDGLVLTVTSRHTKYTELYAALIEAVVASAKAGEAKVPEPEAGTAPAPVEAGARVFDWEGRVSLRMPVGWKQEETVLAEERLQIAQSDISSAPRLLLKDWGGPTSPALVLVKVSAQWTRMYGALTMDKLDDPPRLLVKSRSPGSMDYLIALEHGTDGFILQLTAKADVFDRWRPVADEVARSVHFADAPWAEPEEPAGGVGTSYRKLARVHGAAGAGPAVDAVLAALPDYEKAWGKVGPGDAGKAGPLLVLVVEPAEFAAAAEAFGPPPAAYDPLRRAVIVSPPPVDPEAHAAWRGALFAALAQAQLHRDLRVVPPLWLRIGLAAVAEAAGRTGLGPDAPHPALLAALRAQIPAGGEPPPFETLEDAPLGALRTKEPLRACAWGYTHLFCFGRGTLVSHYKRWIRELEKCDGAVPPFDRKGYDKSATDLARHLERLEER